VLRLLLAWAHLIALGIGLAAVWARARSLGRLEHRALTRVFAADTAWGIAAAVWISTGLWRLLAGTEKDLAYYMRNDAFLAKMGLLGLILALEIWPMITLIRWRRARGRSSLDMTNKSSAAKRMAMISYVQLLIVLVMVFLAVAMARGYGSRA
jgi:putative membrane protein